MRIVLFSLTPRQQKLLCSDYQERNLLFIFAQNLTSMKNTRLINALAALACTLCALASAPAGYYSTLNGKSEEALKTATYNLIHNFTQVSSYSALPDYFRKTDCRPNSNYWWDMYSNINRNLYSFSGLNREHSFPKSWWGGSTSVPAYVDLNHLYPADGPANQAKSNYPLGVVDTKKTVKFDNGVTLVGYPVAGQGGGASLVFEPADEYKGDFARTYFYMATCYQNLTWSYKYMVSQNLYPTLNPWSVNLLLQWHRADPVSQKETERNDVVYSVQGNRNPFIDLPELAEYIWGTKKGEAFTPGEVVTPPTPGTPELTAPNADMQDLDFGQVAIGQSKVLQLFVKGKDLSGAIDVMVYRDNASMWSLSQSSIPATLACADGGYWLQIKYQPTATGQHTARLLLQGDFGSRGVGLKAECLPMPTLTAPTATAPTEVLTDSYVANWTPVSGETADYYVVTRTQYFADGQMLVTELETDGTSLEIDGFGQSRSESYAVQSVRLEMRSPMSNVVFVDHSALFETVVSEPLLIYTYPSTIRFACSAPQTGCCIYNAAGMLVQTADRIENNFEVTIAPGVYLVNTAEHRRPIKVVVP